MKVRYINRYIFKITAYLLAFFEFNFYSLTILNLTDQQIMTITEANGNGNRQPGNGWEGIYSWRK